MYIWHDLYFMTKKIYFQPKFQLRNRIELLYVIGFAKQLTLKANKSLNISFCIKYMITHQIWWCEM